MLYTGVLGIIIIIIYNIVPTFAGVSVTTARWGTLHELAVTNKGQDCRRGTDKGRGIAIPCSSAMGAKPRREECYGLTRVPRMRL